MPRLLWDTLLKIKERPKGSKTGKLNRLRTRAETLPGPIFTWIGHILDAGLFQTKIKNYSKLGIRVIQLTNGSVKGVKELKGSRKTKTLL